MLCCEPQGLAAGCIAGLQLGIRWLSAGPASLGRGCGTLTDAAQQLTCLPPCHTCPGCPPCRMRLASFVFGSGALLYQAELYGGLAIFSGYIIYDTQVMAFPAGPVKLCWGGPSW